MNKVIKVPKQVDSYSHEHHKRVSLLASIIGQRMGLPTAKIENLRFAGLTHDIGKQTLPSDILTKHSLDENELMLFHEHPVLGHTMLVGMNFAPEVSEAVLQHHERLDGSGYPKGLKNGQISVCAKILAVAEVVDAMSCCAPYKKGLGIDLALAEIAKNSGTLYDKDVVNACLAVFCSP